jgi:tetratricopeptide (TPR) repeat protein
MKKTVFVSIIALLIPAGFTSCASRRAMQAEEYYTIGMAFFDLGRFSDAEFWLIRARSADRTMVASEYNLGRIAFETGRFEDAAVYFETILKRDPENVMALRAAAFSRIKNGDIEKAEALYNQVLKLVPESADDGFNHALVLYGMEKYEASEEVLKKYPIALEEKPSSILLLARTQKAQNKVEAVDSYAKWLLVHTESANPQGLYEYAQVLESAGFYARAMEQYRDAIEALTQDTETLKRSTLRFEEARLLLTMDPENEEGITGLSTAVREGFLDRAAIQALLDDERVIRPHREEITRILATIRIPGEPDDEDEEDVET